MLETLITTTNKTAAEIATLLDQMNVKGNVIVGNQCGREGTYVLSGERYTAKVIELTEYGTSLNRNTLLLASSASYITFLDDDTLCPDTYIDICLEAIERLSKQKCQAVRLNVVSLNQARPIKQVKRETIATINKIRSYGVWGAIFDRSFLISKGIRFHTDIGPGTAINHGEDTLFLADLIRNGGKMLLLTDVLYSLKQQDSCWFNSKNLSQKLISDGFLHSWLYPALPHTASLAFAIRHYRDYKEEISLRGFLSLLFLGNRLFRQYKRTGLIDQTVISKAEDDLKTKRAKRK